MIFERMLNERKFLSIYKGYFLFDYLERTALKRKEYILKERYSINRPCPYSAVLALLKSQLRRFFRDLTGF